jgi:hypothetical protein
MENPGEAAGAEGEGKNPGEPDNAAVGAGLVLPEKGVENRGPEPHGNSSKKEEWPPFYRSDSYSKRLSERASG